MDNGMKLAVLIDAENISSKYIKTILDEASNNGNVIFRRIYGDWTNNQMAAWKSVVLDNSIQPIQQYCNTVGKNSSDSAMIIDAMDLLYTGRVEGFCIVSSDSDFTRLAARLRESEKFVIGMGELKTPKSFINACSKFSYLDILFSEEKEDEKKAQPLTSSKKQKASKSAQPDTSGQIAESCPSEVNEESGADKANIIRTIKTLVEERSDDDGWIFSGTLGNLLIKRFPDFDVRNFGYKKFVQFIDSLDAFEVKKTSSAEDSNVQIVYIRNKTQPKK